MGFVFFNAFDTANYVTHRCSIYYNRYYLSHKNHGEAIESTQGVQVQQMGKGGGRGWEPLPIYFYSVVSEITIFDFDQNFFDLDRKILKIMHIYSSSFGQMGLGIDGVGPQIS